MKTHDIRRLQRNRLVATIRKPWAQVGRLIDGIVRDEAVKQGFGFVDAPCHSSDEDAFGFSTLAADLCGAMTSFSLQSPYTLCIDGQWGSGKSSLARLMYSRLSQDVVLSSGLLPVWIDTSLMLNGATVTAQVANDTLDAAVRLAQRVACQPERKARYADDIMPLLPPTHPAEQGGNTAQEAQLQSQLRADAKAWLEKWPEGQATANWDLPRLRGLITSIRHALLGRGGVARIVWFVDDLDRCRADVVMAMLDVHRCLLEQWGSLLVYPMNAQIVEAVVEKHFLVQGRVEAPVEADPHAGVYVEQARTYLEKMFFRRVRPPEPSLKDLSTWLRRLLPEGAFFDGLAEFMRDAYYANPRYVKRFAASVCHLCERFAAAAADDTWNGLLLLNDRQQAIRLLVKTVAFALCDALYWYYEPVRKPDPRQLITSEVSAYAGESVPCIVPDHESGEFVETIHPAPRSLLEFLKSGPRFQDDFAATRSAVLAAESVLPTPRVRWRVSGRIQTLRGQMTRAKKARHFDLTPAEREKAHALVGGWRDGLASMLKIPPEILATLQAAVPDEMAALMKEEDWTPDVSRILRTASEAFSGGREHVGVWCLAAAAVHEAWDEEDMAATLALADQVGSMSTRVAFVRLGLLRHGDSRRARGECAAKLVATDNTEFVQEAVDHLLQILGLPKDAFSAKTLTLADDLDDVAVPTIGLLSDALHGLDRHDDALRLVTAAVQTRVGRKSSRVVRNLARAMRAAGMDARQVVRVYHAAMAKDVEDDLAAAWCTSAIDDDMEAELAHLYAAFDRDPRDSRYAREIGVCLHNNGRRDSATPWLEYAVILDPNGEENRDALRQNLALTRGMKEASKAMDPDYVPRLDEQPLRHAARDGHLALLKRILMEGEVRVSDVILFDGKEFGSPVYERFPELRE